NFADTANYKAYNSSKDKTLFQNLPADAQKIISAVLCYGRNGSRKVPVSGANDADYYFATQVLVWEAQQGLRTIASKKGKPNGTKLAK
ncbi:thioester domain-containing protein, partial [Pseudomonas aeruginosa]|nr:thioester domain-containing protein [Pseudomonas aeruginosa]